MAITAKVIDAAGKTTGDKALPETLFGGEVNVALMHQAVQAQRAASRAGTASTKTRSEVRGGGQKPWRQKGTGRARHGSIRSPIWSGGGIAFGPKPRDYTQKFPKKMRAQALRSALASKAADGAVWVLDGFSEAKTKAAASCLDAAEIGGRVLMVVKADDENTPNVHKAFRNLSRAAFCYDRSLNVYDVLKADAVVFTTEALDAFSERAKDKKERKVG